MYYVAMMLAFVNQVYTLFTDVNWGWLLKGASLLLWIASIYFKKAIITESTLK
jgi:hypothetical protein